VALIAEFNDGHDWKGCWRIADALMDKPHVTDETFVERKDHGPFFAIVVNAGITFLFQTAELNHRSV
jgi:hypothetical protein